MYKTKDQLTEEESIRFNEIVFYNLIQTLLSKDSNPVKLHNFIENVCDIAGCSISVINSVINIIMTDDRRYAPSKEESVYLMKKAQIPVRHICKDTHISQRTYYTMIEELGYIKCEGKFDDTQYEHMILLLITLQDLLDPLTRRTL